MGKRRWRGQDGRAALRIPRGGEEFRLRRLRSQDTGHSRPVSGITGLGLGHSLLRFPPGGLARRRGRPIPAQSFGASETQPGRPRSLAQGPSGRRVLLPPGAAPALLRPTRLEAAPGHAVPRPGREAAGSLGRWLAEEPARGPGGSTSPWRLCNPVTGWGGRYAWFPEHPSPEASSPHVFLGRNSVGSNRDPWGPPLQQARFISHGEAAAQRAEVTEFGPQSCSLPAAAQQARGIAGERQKARPAPSRAPGTEWLGLKSG